MYQTGGLISFRSNMKHIENVNIVETWYNIETKNTQGIVYVLEITKLI